MNIDIHQVRMMLGLAARYVAVCLPLLALWEIAQLPLYTILAERGTQGSVVATLHCTLGDALIAFVTIIATLFASLVMSCFRRINLIALTTVLLSLAITVVIEWLSVRSGRWSYSALMPIDPWLGIGLSPLLQWLAIPAIGVVILRVRLRRWLAELAHATKAAL